MSIQELTVYDFQILRNRNFYRFGDHTTSSNPTCGYPKFQTRIDANAFKIRKSQKKTMKRFERYLEGKVPQASKSSDKSEKGENNSIDPEILILLTEIMNQSIEESFKFVKNVLEIEITDISKSRIKILPDKEGKGLFTNAFSLLLSSIKDKKKQNPIIEQIKSEFLPTLPEVENYSWTLQRTSLKLMKTEIPKSDIPKLEGTSITKEIMGHKFEIKFELPESNVQNSVLFSKHCGFKQRFPDMWCQRKLKYETLVSECGTKELKLGSYHMNYYIDDVLEGVGVVDVLPEMICSLNFFYNQDMKKYGFGIVSVLKEIEFVKEMNQYFPNFRYQNLGSYEPLSHMDYKVDFGPVEIYCPDTKEFILKDDRVTKLVDSNQFDRFAPVGQETDYSENFKDENDIESYLKKNFILRRGNGSNIPFDDLNLKTKKVIISNYGGLFIAIGKTLTKRIGFYIE